MTGRFITFEGVEGSGKTTQARLLAEHLASLGLEVVPVREPGGTALGEAIRALLLQADCGIVAESEFLLFLAARAQNTAEVIRPALNRGAWVVCDRFADSTVAYQGYARGLDLDTVRRMNSFATRGLVPDLTVLLDVPVEVGLKRQSERNRMEREASEFHEAVRQGYLAEARREPERFCVVAGENPVLSIRDYVVSELVRRGWLGT